MLDKIARSVENRVNQPEAAVTFTDEELRQLRSWAVSTVLQKLAIEQGGCEEHHSTDIPAVISDARKLVNFVKGPR